jgi:PAS domain S-box-containing protein
MTFSATTEPSLIPARHFLDALIDAIPTPVLVKDRRHRYVAVNAAFCEFFQRPASLILGRDDSDFFTPEDVAYFQKTDSQSLETGAVIEYERAYTLDGKTQWMLVRKSRLVTPEGDRLVVLVLVDVTVRRQSEIALRTSEDRFRQLTELSADWYWEQDEHFRFSFLSSEVASKSGVDGRSSLGITRWGHPGIDLSSADFAAHRATCEAHGKFRDFTYFRVSDDGDGRWIRVSGEPVFAEDGRFAGYRGVGKDVTVDVASRNELRLHRDNLQQLVDARTEELVAAKNAAEAADRAKSEFLANMSHELRTPMHAILSFARLAADRLATKSGDLDKVAQYIHRIQEGGQRLLLLLNDLLDLSKLEAGMGRYVFAQHDIRELVRGTLAEFEPLLKQRHLVVECRYAPGATQVWCDGIRIGQVLRNLMSNAIKFSPPGGRIGIGSAGAALTADSGPDGQGVRPGIEVTVSDEGVGIPESELCAIFDKFVQSSKTRSGAGGTGLGLAISREIVAQHGGEIYACNRPQGGATFTVRLPATCGARMDETAARELATQ